jgi:hypothetical protein
MGWPVSFGVALGLEGWRAATLGVGCGHATTPSSREWLRATPKATPRARGVAIGHPQGRGWPVSHPPKGVAQQPPQNPIFSIFFK